VERAVSYVAFDRELHVIYANVEGALQGGSTEAIPVCSHILFTRREGLQNHFTGHVNGMSTLVRHTRSKSFDCYVQIEVSDKIYSVQQCAVLNVRRCCSH